MNREHMAGQAPELSLRLPLQVSIFKMGLEQSSATVVLAIVSGL